jgi:phosphohistidine phosphatase
MKDAHLVSVKYPGVFLKTYVVWSSIAKRAADTALIFAQTYYPIECIVF